MEIINNAVSFRFKEKNAATIGFFDGLHSGHRFLLEQLMTYAVSRNLPTMAITFFQHPQVVLQPGFQPELLNTFDERINQLSLIGIDYCLLLDFTESISQMSAKDFIQKKLKNEWNVRLLLIGYDHKFGKNRKESFNDYIIYGQECGMEIIQALELPDIPVSSSHIRNYLLEKNISDANLLLSYHYTLSGKIIKGDQLGKKIDFPTANLEINDKNKIIPGDGVYAIKAFWEERKADGMVYIGRRPSILNGGEKRIEANLFNFSGDLYGKTLQIEFIDFIRPDIQFNSLEELKKQLSIDREKAMAILMKPEKSLSLRA